MTPHRSARHRPAWTAVLTVLMLVASTLAAVMAPGSPAIAAETDGFEPGLIISDAVFYDATTMNAWDIQVFLNSRGASCRPGTDGTPCLKDFTQDTWTRPATDRCAGTYVGAPAESAATIISKVATACGINPQVLIVMLQKEQGLVTGSGAGLYPARYRSAMGFGCPDTAPCDAQYYGFFNQVYSAAAQLRNYALNPTRYSHRAGIVNNVRFHPNSACGSSSVYIQNQATAGLYNYTPYQPNAAALAAGYGTGDACSAYGNRNFWLYFRQWFGPTTQRAPIGTLDAVSTGPTSITVGGWTLDPDTVQPIAVHVYVDGGWAGAMTAAIPRPDVAAAYGKGELHGYQLSVPASTGPHRVCVYAIDSGGGINPELGCRIVSVSNKAPVGVVDAVRVNGTEVTVSGWAFDPDSPAAIGVHLYVDGGWATAVDAGTSRPDVGAAYGIGPSHGYEATFVATAGRHTVCAYGIDTAGGTNPALGCRTFTATSPVQSPPIGVIDAVTQRASTMTVSGWALDPNTSAPITVNIYVDGAQVASRTANVRRADVGAAYGKGDLHGYAAAWTATTGAHQVCLRAVDSTTLVESALDCRNVSVTSVAGTNAAPIGVIDAATASSGRVTLSGWALDPDTPAAIGVHVYVDGRWGDALIADAERTDVAAAYRTGPNHGYTLSVPAAPGVRQVCAYGIDASNGPNPAFQCVSVTVP